MSSQRFTIDADAASVVFVARSSVHPIRSEASATGWLEADLEGERFRAGSGVSGHIEIPLDGLSSGSAIIDREMRRRTGAGDHPAISGDIESTLDTAGVNATITGTIDFMGEAVLVEGEIVLVAGPRIVGTGEFDVRWWGLEPPRLLLLRVDPIVTVEIDLPLLDAT